MSEYHGLPTGVMESPFLRIEYLKEGGQRIIRLFRHGDDRNLLAETPEFGWDTSNGRFDLRGGHRLWHAPQTNHTASPERLPCEIWQEGLSLCLFQRPDRWNRLAKQMDIALDGDYPALTIVHTITNEGSTPLDLAPWAVTQLPLGGQAVLPLPGERSANVPGSVLAFWPYVRLPDPRLQLEGDCMRFNAGPHENEFKLGYFNLAGWVTYERQGVRLTKRFEPQPGKPHADAACNVEIYCNNEFFELETLGPLVTLQPGQSVHHIETWEIGDC